MADASRDATSSATGCGSHEPFTTEERDKMQTEVIDEEEMLNLLSDDEEVGGGLSEDLLTVHETDDSAREGTSRDVSGMQRQISDVLSEEDLDTMAEKLLVAMNDNPLESESDDEGELQRQILHATRQAPVARVSKPPQRRLPNYKRVTVDMSSVYDYKYFLEAAKRVYGDKSL